MPYGAIKEYQIPHVCGGAHVAAPHGRDAPHAADHRRRRLRERKVRRRSSTPKYPSATGNEPVAGDASDDAIFLGTHLSQQTPPEECMTGVREGDAKLCRGGPSRIAFRRRLSRSSEDDASRARKIPFFSGLFATALSCISPLDRASSRNIPDGCALFLIRSSSMAHVRCEIFRGRRVTHVSVSARRGGSDSDPSRSRTAHRAHHSSSVMKSASFRSSTLVPGVCSTPMASMSAAPFARSAAS